MSADEPWLDGLRQKFLARLAEEHAAFCALSEAADREGIIARAHKLAGIAGMLGAPQIGEAALLLEETARSGDDYAAPCAALIDALAAATNTTPR